VRLKQPAGKEGKMIGVTGVKGRERLIKCDALLLPSTLLTLF
jgi:hypothetical protein